jgi:hypothetical protein
LCSSIMRLFQYHNNLSALSTGIIFHIFLTDLEIFFNWKLNSYFFPLLICSLKQLIHGLLAIKSWWKLWLYLFHS